MYIYVYTSYIYDIYIYIFAICIHVLDGAIIYICYYVYTAIANGAVSINLTFIGRSSCAWESESDQGGTW